MKGSSSSQGFDSAVSHLCHNLSQPLLRIPDSVKETAQEIRLRVNQPVVVVCHCKSFFVTPLGHAFDCLCRDALICTKEMLEESFQIVCSYSIFSHQNEIKNGFVSLQGGHRVGICGTAVLQSGEISSLRDISSMNIRIARQLKGAADSLLDLLGNHVGGTLLVGPPSCGKTTLLRDMARQLSLGTRGRMQKIAVVDERGELGGCVKGVCQNDLGLCDVLNGYPKGEGILQSIRCLSPDIIICDEVGGEEDIVSIQQGLNAGVAIVASMHAGGREEFFRRSQARRLLQTMAFDQLVFLSGRDTPGQVESIVKEGELRVEIDRILADGTVRSRSGIFTVA